MKKITLTFLVCLITIVSVGQAEWRALTNAPAGFGRFDDIFFLNEQLGWAANGPSGLVFKTEDGGQTWQEKLNVPSSYFRNIEFIDESIGFLGTLDGTFYRTQDGGDSWQPATINPNPNAICGLDAVGNTVYGCGAWFGPAHLIKSSDSGSTWEYTDMTAYATALVEILFVTEELGYASGQNDDGGLILKTENGGLDWEEIYNSGSPGDYVWKLQLMENNTYIYASVSSIFQGKLIKSFDTGVSWEEKNFPDEDVQGVGFVTPTHGWMGGHNSGFYETTDGGDTWTNTGLGSNLNKFFIFNDQFGFASGETIYKYEDALSVGEFTASPPKDLTITVAPMPIKDKLNVSIEFMHVDNLKIDLYSVNGKLLKSLVRDQIMGASNQQYSFEFNYPAGTYFLDIHTNNGRRSVTVVKN